MIKYKALYLRLYSGEVVSVDVVFPAQVHIYVTQTEIFGQLVGDGELDMKKTIYTAAIVLGLLPLFACSVVEGKKKAQEVAESMFEERIVYGDFGLDAYYSELFWQNADEKKWNNIINLVNKAMGNLQSYSLESWHVQSKVHTNQISGTIVVLVYKTVYEKGTGTETLTVFKPLIGDEFSILGHNFNSKRIQRLIDKGIEQATSTM